MTKIIKLVISLVFLVVFAGTVFLIQKNQEAKPYTGPTECPEGFTLYHMTSIEYSFCYDNALGVPTERESGISREAKRGTAYHVNFSTIGAVVTVETANFAKLGDSDVPDTLAGGYDCLLAAENDTELEACFLESDEVIDIDADQDDRGRNNYHAWLKIPFIDDPDMSQDMYFLFIPDLRQDGRYNLQVSSPQYKDGLTRRVAQYFSF